jgi:ATP-binding cassette, subfamily B, bacterial
MSKYTAKNNYFSLKSFFTYLSNYKSRLVLLWIGFVISNILLAVMPIFIGKLVGALASAPIQRSSAITYMWILIAISSLHNISWHLLELVYTKYINPIAYRYENILFKEVIEKPYPYFVDKFTGKLSSYINTTNLELRGFLENVYYNYTGSAISIIAIFIILTSINLPTGAVFLSGMLCMFFVGRHTIRNSTKYEKIATDVQSSKNGKLIDAVSNFVNIKSFQRETKEIEAIKIEIDEAIKAANKSFVWTVYFWASLSFFVRSFIWPLTIGLNVYLYLHNQITIAQLATLLSTVVVFSSTIWDLIWHFSQFTLKLARIEEAHRYLFGAINIVTSLKNSSETSVVKASYNGTLDLDGLSFAYPDKIDSPVLKNINLTIKKGEKIGVVGRSGSGKTTLTKLLLGYYEMEPGHILIDGEIISGKNLASLISYVPQDTSLFHRTIAENIAYASRNIVTREDIIEASKKAHADEFISKIDDGYDALVGERGVKLSAGQRQRIAIARAMLDNKPILILDEATSALDSESEVLVQKGLEALWEDKTVIAIAHRLSTLRHMDKIIVMDAGHIIEQGTHTELIALKGAYSKLWNHQSGGFLEE